RRRGRRGRAGRGAGHPAGHGAGRPPLSLRSVGGASPVEILERRQRADPAGPSVVVVLLPPGRAPLAQPMLGQVHPSTPRRRVLAGLSRGAPPGATAPQVRRQPRGHVGGQAGILSSPPATVDDEPPLVLAAVVRQPAATTGTAGPSVAHP